MSSSLYQLSTAYKDYVGDDQYTQINASSILSVRQHRLEQFKSHPDYARYEHALKIWDDPSIRTAPHDASEAGEVGFSLLSHRDPEYIKDVIKVLAPWRVGPWQIGDVFIDSEWPCGLRWQQIADHVQVPQQATVADVGCQNGYFMFRCLDWQPTLVVGFEPVVRHYFAFHLFQNILKHTEIHYEPFGYEQLIYYPAFFDVILCLGVLYHHVDPIGILRRIHGALTTKGQLIIDCQGIAGDESVALMPRKLYGGTKGTWWLPTATCLESWISRAGFSAVEIFDNSLLRPDQQRATPFAPGRSLADQLMSGGSQTLEGYPPPRRFYAVARK